MADRTSFNGFINVNKGSGATSHDVIGALRRILLFRKIGHSGTLDPRAMGVLPVCLGKATRLAEYIVQCRKKYRAVIAFGVETDSYDADGAVLSERACPNLTKEQVVSALGSFSGEIEQVPPMVSALKRNGQPLYQLARQGIEVERPARRIIIYETEVIDYVGGDYPLLTVDITCSKGTYIRSLAHDLGNVLGVGASLNALTRMQSGAFTLENAFTLEQIAAMAEVGDYGFLLPMDFGISHLPQVIAEEALLSRVLCGNSIPVDSAEHEVCRVVSSDGDLLGMGRVESGLLLMDKVFAGNN